MLELEGQALTRRAQGQRWSSQVLLRPQPRHHAVLQSPKSRKSPFSWITVAIEITANLSLSVRCLILNDYPHEPASFRGNVKDVVTRFAPPPYCTLTKTTSKRCCRAA